MQSAGLSRLQLAAPVLIAAAVMMALTYLCSLYLGRWASAPCARRSSTSAPISVPQS